MKSPSSGAGPRLPGVSVDPEPLADSNNGRPLKFAATAFCTSSAKRW